MGSSGRGGIAFKPAEPRDGYGGGGWDFRQYMQHKTTELTAQYASRVQVLSRALEGVVLHADGLTSTRQFELADLVTAHGGRYEQYYHTTVTHFLVNQLPVAKLKMMRIKMEEAKRRGRRFFVVRECWLLDSARAVCRLDESLYSLDQLSDPRQHALGTFLVRAVQPSSENQASSLPAQPGLTGWQTQSQPHVSKTECWGTPHRHNPPLRSSLQQWATPVSRSPPSHTPNCALSAAAENGSSPVVFCNNHRHTDCSPSVDQPQGLAIKPKIHHAVDRHEKSCNSSEHRPTAAGALKGEDEAFDEAAVGGAVGARGSGWVEYGSPGSECHPAFGEDNDHGGSTQPLSDAGSGDTLLESDAAGLDEMSGGTAPPSPESFDEAHQEGDGESGCVPKMISEVNGRLEVENQRGWRSLDRQDEGRSEMGNLEGHEWEVDLEGREKQMDLVRREREVEHDTPVRLEVEDETYGRWGGHSTSGCCFDVKERREIEDKKEDKKGTACDFDVRQDPEVMIVSHDQTGPLPASTETRVNNVVCTDAQNSLSLATCSGAPSLVTPTDGARNELPHGREKPPFSIGLAPNRTSPLIVVPAHGLSCNESEPRWYVCLRTEDASAPSWVRSNLCEVLSRAFPMATCFSLDADEAIVMEQLATECIVSALPSLERSLATVMTTTGGNTPHPHRPRGVGVGVGVGSSRTLAHVAASHALSGGARGGLSWPQGRLEEENILLMRPCSALLPFLSLEEVRALSKEGISRCEQLAQLGESLWHARFGERRAVLLRSLLGLENNGEGAGSEPSLVRAPGAYNAVPPQRIAEPLQMNETGTIQKGLETAQRRAKLVAPRDKEGTGREDCASEFHGGYEESKIDPHCQLLREARSRTIETHRHPSPYTRRRGSSPSGEDSVRMAHWSGSEILPLLEGFDLPSLSQVNMEVVKEMEPAVQWHYEQERRRREARVLAERELNDASNHEHHMQGWQSCGWTCSICTYMHSTAQADFLACDVCGAIRMESPAKAPAASPPSFRQPHPSRMLPPTRRSNGREHAQRRVTARNQRQGGTFGANHSIGQRNGLQEERQIAHPSSGRVGLVDAPVPSDGIRMPAGLNVWTTGEPMAEPSTAVHSSGIASSEEFIHCVDPWPMVRTHLAEWLHKDDEPNAAPLIAYAEALLDCARFDELGYLASFLAESCAHRPECHVLLRTFIDAIEPVVSTRLGEGARFKPLCLLNDRLTLAWQHVSLVSPDRHSP